MSVSPTILNHNGAAITNCVATPALSMGLWLNPTTCVISGTPSGVLAATTYSVVATNSAGSSSAALVTLSIVTCPPNYAFVPANSSVGVTNAFCVAKYEMKNVTGVATSQSASTPWVSINQIDAKTACTNLGTGYDLISNPEWMTIALNIENLASNWSGNAVGSGMLNRGHSDSNPNGACDGALENVQTDCSTADTGHQQKRTHTLSNGQVIWDFAGNVWEWTDWSLGGGLAPGPTSCDGVWTQLPDLSCLPAVQYKPANPANKLDYNSDYGLGKFFGGNGGAARRGGPWNGGVNVGAFALSLNANDSAMATDIGFRCVWRPESSSPTLSYSGATGTSGVVGNLMSIIPTTLFNNGAAITNCSVSPALPVGLNLDPISCVISGTPTTATDPTTYSITAMNAYGVSSIASVTLAIGASAPNLFYIGANGTSGSVGVAMSVSPTIFNHNGAAITNCVATPALSMGLSLNPTTCVISGTPSGVLAATTYSVVATNSAGSSSAALVTLSVCPENYAFVPANFSLGVTNAFCVAKYEMKCVGNACASNVPNNNAIATSQATGAPWVDISQTHAKTACTNLGTGYDLISNPEWMTIAFNIENLASNWSGNAVGSGMLNRGHSDSSPGSALAVTDVNDPYVGTGNNSGQAAGSGWEQKRTHTISNGQVIWDVAGNVSEWTDWSLGGGLTLGPTSCPNSWTQLPALSCGALSAADYMPANPASVTAANYNSNYGLGQFFGGVGGAARRSGYWDNTVFAGVFNLALNFDSSLTENYVGFRCVFRP